jgi:hypothetical protein
MTMGNTPSLKDKLDTLAAVVTPGRALLLGAILAVGWGWTAYLMWVG